MARITIGTGTSDDFFKRGKKIARLADAEKKIPSEVIITFEDPAEIAQLFTGARIAVFRAVKEAPGSITEISERLQRDRSAVKRDIDQLAHVGLLRVREKPLPGHGRMKEVQVAAKRFKIEAEVA